MNSPVTLRAAEEWNEYMYAKQLAQSIHDRCYPESPQWEPLPDLMGVLTQIDNMSVGMDRKEEPKRVLTEWQRGEIGSIIHQYACDDYNMKGALIAIDEILSEPEPPKYQPRENEAVLVDCDGRYLAGVFTRMVQDGYCVSWGLGELHYDKVFPFDPSKVGTVTND